MGLPQRRALAAAAASPGRGGSRRLRCAVGCVAAASRAPDGLYALRLSAPRRHSRGRRPKFGAAELPATPRIHAQQKPDISGPTLDSSLTPHGHKTAPGRQQATIIGLLLVACARGSEAASGRRRPWPTWSSDSNAAVGGCPATTPIWLKLAGFYNAPVVPQSCRVASRLRAIEKYSSSATAVMRQHRWRTRIPAHSNGQPIATRPAADL